MSIIKNKNFCDIENFHTSSKVNIWQEKFGITDHLSAVLEIYKNFDLFKSKTYSQTSIKHM